MNQPQGPNIFEMLLPFIFIFVIFYFLIIRPQSKRMKEQEAMLSKLQRGDAVVTQSGILGVIDAINDHIVTLEVASNTKIKVLRKQIAGLQEHILQNSNPAQKKS
ncbi:MAG: preprotein translocase subunit YajC [Bdellovibrionaceae bacterium]|nr:preprotein translocase subunit YajC [Pseudobdellovibrionaceae bacterium]MDW8190627.1 preprotein translocase subunit YajC [Pseudobdellovibrionaceae bacterium]